MLCFPCNFRCDIPCRMLKVFPNVPLPGRTVFLFHVQCNLLEFVFWLLFYKDGGRGNFYGNCEFLSRLDFVLYSGSEYFAVRVLVQKGKGKMESMLEVKNVTKLYNRRDGISNVCLNLQEGTVNALIGPNGAGKTTLIRVMAGLSMPERGEVLLKGNPTVLRTCKKDIGYALESEKGYPKKTVMEMLDFVCEIKYNGEYAGDAEKILQDFQLWDSRNKLIQECSSGMKKKLEIAISFLGSPALILLDEPTNGVDTNGILMLKQYIEMEKRAGKIIVITSHVLDFVESLADTAVFLKQGEVVEVLKNAGGLEDVYRKNFIQYDNMC